MTGKLPGWKVLEEKRDGEKRKTTKIIVKEVGKQMRSILVERSKTKVRPAGSEGGRVELGDVPSLDGDYWVGPKD